jgi:hypothetical protein
MKNIKISDVLKKDVRVLCFLLIFGGVTILSETYLKTGNYSVLFGAMANYIAFRAEQELKNEGYKSALQK